MRLIINVDVSVNLDKSPLRGEVSARRGRCWMSSKWLSLFVSSILSFSLGFQKVWNTKDHKCKWKSSFYVNAIEPGKLDELSLSFFDRC